MCLLDRLEFFFIQINFLNFPDVNLSQLMHLYKIMYVFIFKER